MLVLTTIDYGNIYTTHNNEKDRGPVVGPRWLNQTPYTVFLHTAWLVMNAGLWTRAYARGGLGITPLAFDILQKLYYLIPAQRRLFSITFTC